MLTIVVKTISRPFVLHIYWNGIRGSYTEETYYLLPDFRTRVREFAEAKATFMMNNAGEILVWRKQA